MQIPASKEHFDAGICFVTYKGMDTFLLKTIYYFKKFIDVWYQVNNSHLE